MNDNLQNQSNNIDNEDDDDFYNNEKYKIIKEKIEYEIDENGNRIKVVFKLVEKNNKYYKNFKKAWDAYRERNKEELNKKAADRRKNKYNNDPDYKEKIKEKNRQYYRNKKNNDSNVNL